jgi:hypothetical protein
MIFQVGHPKLCTGTHGNKQGGSGIDTTPPQQHPAGYQLGQHTVELGEDEAITIVNETVAVQLEHDEIYPLAPCAPSLFRYREQHVVSEEAASCN